MDKEFIENSKSAGGAPFLVVRKPDKYYPFAIYYGKLYFVTRIDPYRIPNIQEVLSQLRLGKYFQVHYLVSEVWQIEMDSREKEKTAFNAP